MRLNGHTVKYSMAESSKAYWACITQFKRALFKGVTNIVTTLCILFSKYYYTIVYYYTAITRKVHIGHAHGLLARGRHTTYISDPYATFHIYIICVHKHEAKHEARISAPNRERSLSTVCPLVVRACVSCCNSREAGRKMDGNERKKK